MPKELVYAAVHGGPARIDVTWGWQLFRSSGDSRERKTQRKDELRSRITGRVTCVMEAASAAVVARTSFEHSRHGYIVNAEGVVVLREFP